MRANELIEMMRSRLRDEAKEGWSDPELISSINFALSAVAHKLLLWKNRWISTTEIGEDTYSLPEDFMAPIAVVYDGKIIDIKGIEWALSHIGNDKPCAFIDNNSLIIAPVPDKAASILLNYHGLTQIRSVGDVLDIPAETVDTVLFYALSLSLQKEANEESLAQSKFYLNLFKDRCGDIAKIAQQRRSSRSPRSRFQKV